MNNKLIVGVIALAAILGAIFLFTDKEVESPAVVDEVVAETNTALETQLAGSETPEFDENGNELIGGDAVAGGVDNTPEFAQEDNDETQEVEETNDSVSFTVLGGNFYYDLEEIRVTEGQEVTINFRSVDGFHDWVVDEFGAATAKVQTDGETSVTFVADKKGTFEYYCSVGSHRANGMVGNLIVE